ncbi:MAG: CrcB family protein [Armatimonadetes bacterium]|nr:CrcB family protein [Armatimonadota bacterium]
MKIVWIAVAGVLGTLSRYGLGLLLNKPDFPLGTLVINVLGCLLIGVVFSLFSNRIISDDLRAILATGFLGAFTTYSAFIMESFALTTTKDWARLGAYFFGNLVFGFLAFLIGKTVGARYAI